MCRLSKSAAILHTRQISEKQNYVQPYLGIKHINETQGFDKHTKGVLPFDRQRQ